MQNETRWVASAGDFPMATFLAANRRRLYGAAFGLQTCNALVALFNAHYVMQVSGSVGVNLALITLQFGLIIVAGYVTALAAGVLFFGEQWRRYSICGEPLPAQVDEVEAALMTRDHTLGFWLLLASGLAVAWAMIAIPTDSYIQRYNAYGYFGSMLRAADPEQQISALRSIAAPSNRAAAAAEDVRAEVVNALSAPDPEVRAWAAWVAGRIVLVDATPALAQALESADSDEEFAEAATALGMLRDPFAERTMVGLLSASATNPERMRGLLYGLGSMGSHESARAVVQILDLLPEETIPWAVWMVSQARTTHVRAEVLASWPRTGDARECLWAEMLKHVSTLEDLDALYTAFDAALERGECEPVVFIGRAAGDDVRERVTLVVGEHLASKYLKAVFNIAGPGLEPWMETIRLNEDLPLDVRLLAQDLLRALESSPSRLPRQ